MLPCALPQVCAAFLDMTKPAESLVAFQLRKESKRWSNGENINRRGLWLASLNRMAGSREVLEGFASLRDLFAPSTADGAALRKVPKEFTAATAADWAIEGVPPGRVNRVSACSGRAVCFVSPSDGRWDHTPLTHYCHSSIVWTLALAARMTASPLWQEFVTPRFLQALNDAIVPHNDELATYMWTTATEESGGKQLNY